MGNALDAMLKKPVSLLPPRSRYRSPLRQGDSSSKTTLIKIHLPIKTKEHMNRLILYGTMYV